MRKRTTPTPHQSSQVNGANFLEAPKFVVFSKSLPISETVWTYSWNSRNTRESATFRQLGNAILERRKKLTTKPTGNGWFGLEQQAPSLPSPSKDGSYHQSRMISSSFLIRSWGQHSCALVFGEEEAHLLFTIELEKSIAPWLLNGFGFVSMMILSDLLTPRSALDSEVTHPLPQYILHLAVSTKHTSVFPQKKRLGDK